MRIKQNNICKQRFFRRSSGKIVEFAPALIILIVALCPLINLAMIALAGCIIFFNAQLVASQAANSQTYADALRAASAQAYSLNNSGFAKFVKVQPVAGYYTTSTGHTGYDLYVCATTVATAGGTTRFGPNKPVPPPIDLSSYVYEFSAQATYTVHPFVDMSQIPFVNQIPGLGVPVQLTFISMKSAEHPQGLDQPSTIASATINSGSVFNAIGTTGGSTFSASAWNYPNIYTLINNAGAVVVSENVITVPADLDAPTPTGISVAPGESLWIDTRADGLWAVSPTQPNLDANGYSLKQAPAPSPGSNYHFLPISTYPVAALIGQAGTNTPFFVGKSKLNYKLTGTGQFSLMMNDSDNHYSQNVGAQSVRVIITSP